MSSVIQKSIWLLAFGVMVTMPSSVCAQMSDLGLMSGTGTAFLPTVSFIPESQFALNIARFSLLNADGRSITNTAVSGGLSDAMDVTVIFRSGETGGDLAQSSFGISAKLTSPWNIPLMSSTVIWAGAVSSSSQDSAKFYPSNLIHVGIISEPRFLNSLAPKSLNRLQAGLVLGLVSADNSNNFLCGANCSYPLNEHIKLGTEVVHNYFGMNDWMETFTAIWAPTSNIGIQLNPGLCQTSGVSSMTVSFGITFSTTAIRFLQAAKVSDEENLVPSFDELQKQINQEKKDAGKQD